MDWQTYEIKPGADLSDANLSGHEFYREVLRGGAGANLTRCVFKRANLRASRHYHSDFGGANLTEADMRDTFCYEAKFGSRYRENTVPALLLRTDFRGAYLGGSDLDGVNASGGLFSGADLDACRAWGTSFDGADFAEAKLTMLNLYGYNITLDGAPSSFLFANLENADLSGAFLVRCIFVGANLTGANLHNVNLNGANLSGANLSGANLSGANLSGATMPDGTIHR